MQRLGSIMLIVAVLMLASACGRLGSAAGSGQSCSDHVESAQRQIDQATMHLRAVQDAASEMDARQEASDGMAAFRTGLTTMRDHGECFPEEDRAWAVQSLEIWESDKAFANVMGCYYAKVGGATVPNFCNFED